MESKTNNIEKTNNIYHKLQIMRVTLQDSNITMTGHNKYSDFTYFELSDFMPVLNKIMLENKTTGIYQFGKEEASLRIVDIETKDEIVFTIPFSEVTVKGANAMQNIGALTTYTRRYLYMIAFEISEQDSYDTNANNDINKPDLNKPICEAQINSLRKLMETTGVTENAITERYEVNSIEEMTENVFYKVMQALNATKKKQESKEK